MSAYFLQLLCFTNPIDTYCKLWILLIRKTGRKRNKTLLTMYFPVVGKKLWKFQNDYVISKLKNYLEQFLEYICIQKKHFGHNGVIKNIVFIRNTKVNLKKLHFQEGSRVPITAVSLFTIFLCFSPFILIVTDIT